MPKVPERKLSYGEVLAKNRKLGRFKDHTPGTKSFPRVSFKEPRKDSKHGAVRTWKPSEEQKALYRDKKQQEAIANKLKGMFRED